LKLFEATPDTLSCGKSDAGARKEVDKNNYDAVSGAVSNKLINENSHEETISRKSNN